MGYYTPLPLNEDMVVARDLEVSLAINNGEISPEPLGETLEMLLILGQIHAWLNSDFAPGSEASVQNSHDDE